MLHRMHWGLGKKNAQVHLMRAWHARWRPDYRTGFFKHERSNQERQFEARTACIGGRRAQDPREQRDDRPLCAEQNGAGSGWRR